jgi:predicted ATP-binding protein involved in virulence
LFGRHFLPRDAFLWNAEQRHYAPLGQEENIMHVKKLEILNFRGIRYMEIELHRRMNVFVGINGAGKSSLLDAIGYLLTPAEQLLCGASYEELLSNLEASGEKDFPASNVREGEKGSRLSITMNRECVGDRSWYMTTSVQEGGSHLGSGLLDLLVEPKWLLDEFFLNGGASSSIAIFVYYRTRRSVDSVPINAWTNRNFNFCDAYKDALVPQTDFKEFFEWFRNREDLENEERAEGRKEPDPMMVAIRQAIGSFLDTLEDIRVRRRDPLRMIVTKNDQELRIEQLSDGEKCLLAMIGDLARRLAIANEYESWNPLEGEGVVLIDEVDLHLHPQWQRMILPRLMETFPNCQFIVTTHSPQILGELKSEHVIRLMETESGIKAIPANGETFGMTSDMILETQMVTPERNKRIQDMLEEAFLVVERGNIDRAKELMRELKKMAPDIPELIRLDMRISRKEVKDT